MGRTPLESFLGAFDSPRNMYDRVAACVASLSTVVHGVDSQEETDGHCLGVKAAV